VLEIEMLPLRIIRGAVSPLPGMSSGDHTGRYAPVRIGAERCPASGISACEHWSIGIHGSLHQLATNSATKAGKDCTRPAARSSTHKSACPVAKTTRVGSKLADLQPSSHLSRCVDLEGTTRHVPVHKRPVCRLTGNRKRCRKSVRRSGSLETSSGRAHVAHFKTLS
jgi:hypothetical protein